MTEKQIKKAIELAEGFEIFYDDLEDIYIRLSNNYLRWTSILNITEWEHYSLLLYRARETWNKKGNDPLDIVGDDFVMNNSFVASKDYTPTTYLTAQEQALEAALEEVL